MLWGVKIVSIDFGGSTIDVVSANHGAFIEMNSYERTEVDSSSLEVFLDCVKVDFSGVDEIRVTGGKSHRAVNCLGSIPVRHVNEIEAIGMGGKWLLDKTTGDTERDFLVASMGTGTCMVAVCGNQFWHVGGTGVGGGTFIGLCKLLLKESDPQKLSELFLKGDRWKVDLSVGDIVGDGIGRVPADMTASNLGKIARLNDEINFHEEDLAAGIVNLVGQTIATSAVFAARAENISKIVLTGKLTRIKPIVDIIFEVGKLYERHIILPPQAEYVSAIGAAVVK